MKVFFLVTGSKAALGPQAADHRPANQTRAEDHEVPAPAKGEECHSDSYTLVAVPGMRRSVVF